MDSTMITLYLLVNVLFLASSVRADLDSEYTNSAYLDESKTYKLYWKINNEKKSIQFATRVKTLGWVGFGISSGNGNMVGSDVVIGWVKDNKGYLKDRYADAKALPPIDDKQDYTLIAARESNGETIIEFSRLWNTCDEKDVEVEVGTARLIYAYHTNDPSSEDMIPKHTTRGSRSLILLNVYQNKPRLPIDTKYFDLRQNDTVIPSAHTTYLCKAFEIPQFSKKSHIVQIEPVITDGNEGYVHRMLVYQCRKDFPRSQLNGESNCFQNNIYPGIAECGGNPIVAAWAIGGGPMVFPNHTGLAIGTSDAPRFVVLEIHYDNPKKIPGIHDSSGLRFYYTPTLRQYDAGILFVGDAIKDPDHTIIPSKQEKWLITGYCVSNCTKNINSSLPDKGINVFGALLHAHLLGMALWTRHVRNGTELPEIARDNHYDFNYQEYQIFDKEIHVLPLPMKIALAFHNATRVRVSYGDDIIHECLYQSMNKKEAVYGGRSTKDEMCLNFLYYYPKVDLNQCTSLNNGFFKFIRQNFLHAHEIPSRWTEEMVQEIKESYINETRVYTYCKNLMYEPLTSNRKWILKPVIKDPLKQPDVCKPSSASATAPTRMPLLLIIAYFFKVIIA